MKKNFLKRVGVILLVGVLSFSLMGCSGKNTITVGTKDFGENIVLGEMLSQLIENHTDLKVKRKLNMGGTFVCFEAIKNGDIDLYPEYTGTGLTAHLKMDVINNPKEAYRTVSDKFEKKFSIKWLEPFGFNNTYAIAVTKEVYNKYKTETISDLEKVSNGLVFGAEHEFFDRQDGYDGLIKLYGLKFGGEPKKMNVSLKYKAIGSGDMDVTDAYSTDGPIKQYDLKVLKDDKGFFPPYYAAPIVRKSTLKDHPELEKVLNMLSGVINDEIMTELNYKIDVEGLKVEKVAKDFLTEKGLLD